MRVIGRGTFGKVRIVEHCDSHQLYAMKCINIDDCIGMDAVRNIIRERTILEQLDHPFLCRLQFAFQDDSYMYMITDLMLGGDLHYHISSKHQFSEDVLRFWFAELSSAVRFLHSKNVVHRDIKPQNILMDEFGHVHLADFNIATYIHSKRLITSSSGTSYYMAPEVYKGGGYNESVDWWSLGVTFYECVYGKKPFDCETSDELSMAIRRGHVQYSSSKRLVSGECLSIMQGFLEMNPSKRLGQGYQGWVNLIQHPFFRSVDWRRLESKDLKPPFQPSSDKNNFDPTFDLEQLFLDDFGSSARNSSRHRKSSDSVKYEKDRALIKEKFKPFDFTIFEKYEGFKDPVKRTVGEPPDWVKPAFEGAERDLLPITRITTNNSVASTSTTATNDNNNNNHDNIYHETDNLNHNNNHNTNTSMHSINNQSTQSTYSQHPISIDTSNVIKKSPSLWRSASANNLKSRTNYLNGQSSSPMVTTSTMSHQDNNNNINNNNIENMSEIVRKRRSLGAYQHGRSTPTSPLANETIDQYQNYNEMDQHSHFPSPPQGNVTTSLSEEYAMSLHGVRKKQSTRSFRERRERDRKSVQP
ncbi:unnamed protein product [Cunninghamella blakesleeana]